MDHYWSPATKEFALKLTTGRYQVVARFQGEGARTNNSDMPGVALLNFWKGVVQSNPLEFVVWASKRGSTTAYRTENRTSRRVVRPSTDASIVSR